MCSCRPCRQTFHRANRLAPPCLATVTAMPHLTRWGVVVASPPHCSFRTFGCHRPRRRRLRKPVQMVQILEEEQQVPTNSCSLSAVAFEKRNRLGKTVVEPHHRRLSYRLALHGRVTELVAPRQSCKSPVDLLLSNEQRLIGSEHIAHMLWDLSELHR